MMRGRGEYLVGSVLLASLGSVHAKLDLNSAKNIVIYWGKAMIENISIAREVPELTDGLPDRSKFLAR